MCTTMEFSLGPLIAAPSQQQHQQAACSTYAEQQPIINYKASLFKLSRVVTRFHHCVFFYTKTRNSCEMQLVLLLALNILAMLSKNPN